ncbi:MAG TPA: hypothetical protein VFE18_04770 [Phenylobacterium sp.]|jgi:hypothetical protein|uniref:hypothetical protein n=1 Tax=Phenylobacterium sp. TaxID=1871053 RepID=UPI002D6B89EE|nr:hypothetical protein [Phenylobacterium sp.]HZZ67466.1 hypothetical protein [Phenylobacterium sp.]
MTPRRIATLAALALALTTTAPSAAAAGPYRAPRTADGQPDLQGLWTSLSATNLERAPNTPLTFATRAQETAFEAAAAAASARVEAAGLGQGVSEWHQAYPMARLDGKLRTSWIVSPADGRLPWRPEALARYRVLMAAAVNGAAANPEDRPPTDRCLLGSFASNTPPMINPAVAAGKQIVQTKTEVAILSEMNHDLRIVRLAPPRGSLSKQKGRVARDPLGDSRHPARHPPADVRLWMGDSIGHWEGETLVVETANFHPQEAFRGPVYMISPDARVTERFTRTGPHEIRYAFEVDDPATFTQVWKGEMPLHPDKGPIYEFACHEGNYSMPLMLQVARAAEKGR